MTRTRWVATGLAAVVVLATIFTLALRSLRNEVEEIGRATARSAEPAISEPTRIRPAQSLFRARNFGRAVAALRRRVGDAGPMVKVQVLPYGVDFHLRRGRRGAYGFQWYAKELRLRQVEVRVLGPGDLTDEDFPLEVVTPEAVRKLIARVREEDPAFQAYVLTLERVPPDGYLLWAVLARDREGNPHVWHARANGTGLAEPDAFSRRFRE